MDRAMDRAIINIHIALALGSDVSLVIEKDGRPKVVSGIITGLNDETKMVTLGLHDAGLDQTFNTDSIRSYELSAKFLQDAIILSRFSSYTDNTGTTYYTMHPSSNAQQQPQPLKENETGAGTGIETATEITITPDTYSTSTALIQKNPLWYAALSGQHYGVMQKDLVVALRRSAQVERDEALVLSLIIDMRLEEAKSSPLNR